MPNLDFRERATEQLATLQELMASPRVNKKRNRGIHDGWRIILKPRKARMLRRLRNLREARRWSFGSDDGADVLLPSQWKTVIRNIATFYVAEVAGCLDQYESIRLVWKQNTWFGTKTAPGQIIKGNPSAAKVPAEERERAKKTMNEILGDWAARRKTLQKLQKDFRSLMIDMQKAEEGRLKARIRKLKQNDRSFDADKASAALADMKIRRLDGQMRKWLGPHGRARRALGE